MDCLWDYFNAGGDMVEVAPDGAVWVAFYDQEPTTSSDFPNQMGLFRTLDNGLTWEYQGAGVENESAWDLEASTRHEFLWCKDFDTGHEATPFGQTTAANEGNAFNGGVEAVTTDYTWGNPGGLAALSGEVAVMSFTSHGAVDGRVAYTLDGV